jgi:hypothetical protein
MSDELPSKRKWLSTVAQIKIERGCEEPRCAGYPRDIARALTFDHRPGVDKLFEISQAVRGRVRGGRLVRPGTGGSEEVLQRVTWQEILAEIAKCDVVCKNCHEVRNTERGVASEAELD